MWTLPMLVNEVQQQSAEMRNLKQQVAELEALNPAMQIALPKSHGKNELLVRR